MRKSINTQSWIERIRTYIWLHGEHGFFQASWTQRGNQTARTTGSQPERQPGRATDQMRLDYSRVQSMRSRYIATAACKHPGGNTAGTVRLNRTQGYKALQREADIILAHSHIVTITLHYCQKSDLLRFALARYKCRNLATT